jgi:hypothetical protein
MGHLRNLVTDNFRINLAQGFSDADLSRGCLFSPASKNKENLQSMKQPLLPSARRERDDQSSARPIF